MQLLNRYLFGQLLTGTLFVSLTFAAAIWLTQSLRFLDMAINGGAPLSLFLGLVMLTLPSFMVVVLPVAAFVVILFVYHRNIADHEAVVMQASGVSPLRLAQPALLLGVIVALIVLAMNVQLAPVAQREMKDLRNQMRAEYTTVLLREGVFNTLQRGITIYVREKAENGELKGILIHERRKDAPAVTVTARRGAIIETEAGSRAVVYEGVRHSRDPTSGEMTSLSFDRYAFDFSLSEPNIGMQWREASERTFLELLEAAANPQEAVHAASFRAEAHARLASPLLALGFAALAPALLLFRGFSRKGGALRIWLTVGLATTCQGLMLAANSVSRSDSTLIALQYGAGLLPILLAGFFFLRGRRRPMPRRLEAAA